MNDLNLEKYTKYALLVGEDTYASTSAQSPDTARRMKSLYPSLAGDLQREQRHPKFLDALLSGGRVGMLEQFRWFNSSTKTFTTFFFAATATKLYKQKVGTDADWVEVTAVGALDGIPIGKSLNNLFHFSDGVSSWIFDGTDWVKDGLEIPSRAPYPVYGQPATLGLSVITAVRSNGVATLTFSIAGLPAGLWILVAGVGGGFDGTYKITSAGGNVTSLTYDQVGLSDVSLGAGGTINEATFSIVSNRYYWTTWADKTASRLHESSSSPRSIGTGPETNKFTALYLRSGVVATTSGSAAVVGSGTDFSSRDVGLKILIGTAVKTIVSVTDAQHLTADSTYGSNASSQQFVIYPSRATHWRIYASASEEDKAGLLLGEVAIGASAAVSSLFYDQSPFIDQANTYFQKIERPLRNDPTPPTHIMEIHKRRIFRRRETQPNFFNYSAYEEVLNGLAGAAEESVPGTDDNTVSDKVNESSYPDESDQITSLCSHGGALFVGTDDEMSPVFGESIDDFQFSDVSAFSVGTAGRFAVKSTPFGLLFGSSDKILYLYPSQAPPASDATSSLIELSRPKRNTFETIKSTDLDNWHVVHYSWGRRKWAVTCFQDSDSVFHTFVLDFESKTWCELGTGFASLAVFKIAPGKRVLVGGGSDGYVYVIDDLTGTYAGSGDYPEGIYRTPVLDFGRPEADHVIYAVEYEKSDDLMPVEVRVYLDPADADNPSGGIVLNMQKTRIGGSRYRGMINASTGGACHAAMIEIKVNASEVDGKLEGLAVYANPVAQFGLK